MRNKAITAVYSAGVIQGIALVAFPAASTIFTSPHGFHFSSTNYGSLFIPQALLSILMSAISPKLTRFYGVKRVFLTGLGANLASMLLLMLSAFFMQSFPLSYGILLIATSCIGIGFGLTVPTLNLIAALLKPERIDGVILVLNALLGIGTALAPVLIAIFVGFGFWWGLPFLMVVCFLGLIAYSSVLALPKCETETEAKGHVRPLLFWVFASFALLYGIVETLNGTWGPIYMKKYQEASIYWQSMSLAVFWGTVTLGRVFFAWVAHTLEKTVFLILPFVAATAFILMSNLPSHNLNLSVLAFAIAGFGCSALLPLTISLGSVRLSSMSGSVAGDVIAFYLLGYGIAAFGAGPLQEMAHISLKTIFGIGAFISIILGVVAFVITKEDV